MENLLIDIRNIRPQVRIGHGWDCAATVRVAVSGSDGAPAIGYHAVLPPGVGRSPHVNNNRDEILIYLTGSGVAGIGSARARVRAGHCQFVPKGVEHFFVNGSDGENTVIVGFYPFASALDETGFKSCPGVSVDTDPSQAPAPSSDGVLVHLDDVSPADVDKADGWFITDFRLPIGAHNGSSTTLFRARFLPGAVHKKHRHDNCEEIYFVISGSGVAGAGRDRVRVKGGCFHHVPKGVEHWLSNVSTIDRIEVVGVYIGSGTVEETGYVYMGEVTAKDVVLAEGGWPTET